ncbi:MAG: AbrB/MazE/SpoVT family DNA-binding domain-containing protein [Clostridia bacterium]|nr:AbrB/MazE/SpoVT family DNA-binding domain-containing protein [Clostridia bacterium]
MNVNIIKIGNSKGIRIPAMILKECHITDEVNLFVKDGRVIIEPVISPRKNWNKEFKLMHENGDDKLSFNEIFAEETKDWKW